MTSARDDAPDLPPARRHRIVIAAIVLVVFVPVAVIVWATRDRFEADDSGSRPGATAVSTVAAALTSASVAPTAAPSAPEPATGQPSGAPVPPVASDVSSTTVPAFAEAFGEGPLVVGGVELRVLVADTGELRGQGLRAVTSLAPYDGMLFVFESEDRVGFTMADTLIALSIGFYDSDGVRVGALEMVPCLDGDDDSCPVYRIEPAFRYALETANGQLPEGDLAIG